MKRPHILILIVGLILFGALARLFPHLNNAAPIGALALFSGAVISRQYRIWGPVLPILAFALSDALLYLLRPDYPFYQDQGFLFQRLFDFGAMIGIFFMGTALHRLPPNANTFLKIGGSAFLGSGIFFLVSNFAVWFGGNFMGGESMSMYPANLAGLIYCYQMGLPFYQGTFIGDILYSGLFFGTYYAALSYRKQIA